MDEFYDAPQKMMTHIVALFGIPRFRIRTVDIVPDSAATGHGALGRRLSTEGGRRLSSEGGRRLGQSAHPLDGGVNYTMNASALAAFIGASRYRVSAAALPSPPPNPPTH